MFLMGGWSSMHGKRGSTTILSTSFALKVLSNKIIDVNIIQLFALIDS